MTFCRAAVEYRLKVLGTWCNGSTRRSHRRNEGSIPFVSIPLPNQDLRLFAQRSLNSKTAIAAGQSVITVTDPSKFYVQAQIEETKVGRLRTGDPVDVKVDSLGKTIQGRVIAINRASSATFSLLPSSNSSGNFTKVTQLVPVRISVDAGDLPLVLGSSVEVHIRVQG